MSHSSYCSSLLPSISATVDSIVDSAESSYSIVESSFSPLFHMLLHASAIKTSSLVKSEAIVIGTAAQLKSVAATKDVTVAGTSLPLSHELKSLGVTLCGAVAQWLAFATRDRKVASSIPDRGIPRNNLG